MSLSKSKISRYTLLKHKKHREKTGLFPVEGIKAVRDTYKHYETEAILSILTLEELAIEGIRIDESNYIKVSESEIGKLSTLTNPPEVIAIYRLPQIEEYRGEELNGKDFYLVLDGIQDPGNLGTIIRTAHWFGIKQIFCSKDTVDLYNQKTIQSTMGSIAKVNLIYTDLSVVFEANKEKPIYGLLLEGENIFEKEAFKPGFIVMGNEGNGIRTALKRYITDPLTIPPANPKEHPDSLNVSIATAITLSQMIR